MERKKQKDEFHFHLEVDSYKLKVNPYFPYMLKKEKIWEMSKRKQAILKNVDKLLEMGFIKEVMYPDWVINVIMV